MAVGYFLRVGDKTTCGGQIISGDKIFTFHGSPAAREGDSVTCGKHAGHYQILGGVSYFTSQGRKIAGTLDSFSSCPCKAQLINSISDSYGKQDEPVRTRIMNVSEPKVERPLAQSNASQSL
ncbi:TPA: PAAR domain-containing protein [Providencia stuartii]